MEDPQPSVRVGDLGADQADRRLCFHPLDHGSHRPRGDHGVRVEQHHIPSSTRREDLVVRSSEPDIRRVDDENHAGELVADHRWAVIRGRVVDDEHLSVKIGKLAEQAP